MRKERIYRWILVFIILTLLPTSLILPDGGYFSKSQELVAISADQRAIIIKNGNEISITFSTGYTGEGEDFGWIIPTSVPPAVEDVREASESVEIAFEVLDKHTAPVITTVQEHGCFPSGTEVLTAYGPHAIETVEAGTEVYACDLATGDWILTKVLKRQSYQWEGDMVTIHIGSIKIQATGNHPFLVLHGGRLASRPLPQYVPKEQRMIGGGRWVEARDLKEGDVLKDKSGEGMIITALSSRHEKNEVYNIEVEGYHNYVVHQNGILVHNGKRGVGERESTTLVTVYGRVTLEHYKVSILGAADASALLGWIQENGYQVNPAAQDVLDTYIDKNWAFVAVKLNPGERRHYENEFLLPLTIMYQYEDLIFPLHISSVSTAGIANITLYVVAESTVSSSNFRTLNLKYKKHIHKSEDPEEYIKACIKKATGLKGKHLAVMWSGRFYISSYQQKETEGVMKELMKTPFTANQAIYLTRLEARMDSTAMTEDLRFMLDSQPKEFQVNILARGSSIPKLIAAAQDGKINTLQKVLQAGANVNASDEYGKTALMWAVLEGHTEAVGLLLQAGADVNARDRDGWTALIRAAYEGHTEIVQILLQAGVDVNARNEYGRTALMSAAWGAHSEIVKILLEAGAEVNVRNKDGETALMIAKEKGHSRIVNLLREAGAKE